MMLNKNLQEINIQNMDVELVAQMFKNYQSNVLFHLEGRSRCSLRMHNELTLSQPQTTSRMRREGSVK